jgi:hypothetical protein
MKSFAELIGLIKSSAQTITDKIHELDDRIEALHRERDAYLKAPLSKEDYMSIVAADVKNHGENYARVLVKSAEKADKSMAKARPRNGLAILPVFAGDGSFLVQGNIAPEALCWYFGDIIVQRIGEALDRLSWPEDAVPVAERKLRLEKIDAELAELNRERDELARQLIDAGLRG